MVKTKKGKRNTQSIVDVTEKTAEKLAVNAGSSGSDNDDDDDDDDSEDVNSNLQKKSVFQYLIVEDDDKDKDSDSDVQDDEVDDENIQAASNSKKLNKKQKKKKSKKEIKTQDDDDEFNFDDLKSDANVVPVQNKKDKKSKKDKKKRKDDDDEEEIERMLAELELEYDGKKPAAPAETQLEQGAGEGKPSISDEKITKKKKGKKLQVDLDLEVDDAIPDSDAQETVDKVSRKRKEQKKKKSDLKPKETCEPVYVEDESETVEVDDSISETTSSEMQTKKDKKSKKTSMIAVKSDKDEKKRPGKKQLLAMQEALKKIKEEEERLRLVEEAKLKAAEEAENQRIEQLKLEKERRELKKQHEKEKKERLKAEGKLLTKAQKAERARVLATIEALRAQGIVVPAIGDKKERVVRPGTRTRTKKQRPTKGVEEEVHEQEVVEELSLEMESSTTLAEKEVEVEVEVEVEDEHVKDAWDESSSEEEEEINESATTTKETVKKVHININEDVNKKNGSGPVVSDSEESTEDDSSSESSTDDDEEDQRSAAEKAKEKALNRIQKRREENESHRTVDHLRSPIVCVLGHVDTGKTKILDKIRHTHVQDGEAGGITQQIGATMVPVDAIREQAKMVKNFASNEIKYPGLLIIDTPGHESFSNLRSRGSSLCDIAILVVDIMHGLEPQTLESINLLKKRKTPFVVALNKIDRLYEWKVTRNKDIRDTIKSQNRNTVMEFEERMNQITVEFAEQGLNAALFYDNRDVRTYVSLVPTSATSGEGMGNLLALVVELTQTMLAKRLAFTEELQATVLELKALPGLGTTMDVILVNGRLREGDTMVLAGMDGPIVTPIRSLLMPQPLKELRVKNPYQEYKEVQAAQGIKVTAKDLEKVIAGLNLTVARHPDEVDILKEEVSREFHAAMSSIKLAERGVYVQASTLGSLEALLEFLRTSKIPYSGIRIGPVVKRDVMKASIMLEHDSQYAVILAFDVKVERDAQELADSLGVRIFCADIIYHLFDRFTEYRERLKNQKRDELRSVAVFPCRLRILPNCIFNSRGPIVVGVSVEAGVVKDGTPLCVPSKEFLEIGIVTTIEINHKQIDCARKGQEVCIKIEPLGGEAPKLYGRHFDHTDMLVSKITRQSIDVCKEYFRDDLQKSDWQLMVELKKLFEIM